MSGINRSLENEIVRYFSVIVPHQIDFWTHEIMMLWFKAYIYLVPIIIAK